jgi:hypothetical protein
MTLDEAVKLLREARKLLSHGCWGGACCTLRREIDEALAEPATDTTSVVERTEDNRLHDEEDSADVWVLRFCDLVEQDGSNERGRLEAFAKLHDAVKSRKARELVWIPVDNQLQYVNLPSKSGKFDVNEGMTTLRVSPRSGVKDKWCWDLTTYGYADTEAEAKEAAVKASKGLR